ncbi:hypothetical protein Y032_0231g3011 [Ancylostoma ceylanicum]|uniref:Uncharacterized protein n=1 Tax=Ancylostoma ceylanicum TaxID=53326 RepID=A0A016SGT1_9BILA|nr:hypothetical protein Y032_0231g3011 [Ancylostoma ceylanicum]
MESNIYRIRSVSLDNAFSLGASQAKLRSLSKKWTDCVTALSRWGLNEGCGETMLQDCPSNNDFQPITEVHSGSVLLKKGYERFKCKARCIFYMADRKYTASEWKTIEKTKFPCDFIETDCKFQNDTKKFIHMRIEEKKSPIQMPALKREQYPDVHLIVLDSVASSHLIRALPRTVNILLNGMEAVQFRKFNKVGSNSRPNGFAALLGKTTEPVVRTLMKLKTIEPDLDYTKFCSNYLDNKTYIPAIYGSAGYKTFDAEDYVATLMYYPNCRGLKYNALDHYYRQFYLRVREDKELSNTHEKGSCRGSVDNILEFLGYYVNSYKVKEII